MSTPLLIIPQSIRDTAEKSIGVFSEKISGSSPKTAVDDHLDTTKALRRAELLKRFTPMENKRLLEIGSGFGTTLAAWTKLFHVEGYGVEPDGEGFGASFACSRELFAINGLDPSRITAACGEDLPFEDQSFDIVYSANVLEHTSNPMRVLSEALRVLRPGGILHFEIPNYLSYFEGHYMVPQPPIIFRSWLPLWVKYICRRDPAFARTLRTELNPFWCRRAVRELDSTYRVELLTLGEDLFLERLSQPFQFEMKQVRGKLQTAISAFQRINIGNWIGKLVVATQGYYPMYLTLWRKDSESSDWLHYKSRLEACSTPKPVTR
jgi:SAM-dependent methyltransferase